MSRLLRCILPVIVLTGLVPALSSAQYKLKLKYPNSSVYAGIEIGSKGVKMSLLEIARNSKKIGSFNILKDTSVNTDFITFNDASFSATLTSVCNFYAAAFLNYNIPTEHIFTVVSSGVKIQAEKDNKLTWINRLADSIRFKMKEPKRAVDVVDVLQEARLSHLGIIPESKRYTTFLIDIGSGNTKGGYFPNGNTKDLKLFQLSWGTKSAANATEKRCDGDKSIANFSKQLGRVISGPVNTEVIYTINESGAYNMSDNIAFSGGISWSVATLLLPELTDNAVVSVTYDDVAKFSEKLSTNYKNFSDSAIVKSIKDNTLDKVAIAKEVKRVHQVFDQKSLLAGTALLLKIMRQFEGIYEKKQFYLIKNGQVGWISAYVDQSISQ
ncbi:exopolyphosphatase [soil metagenome]